MSKLIASRIKSVLPNIIHHNQTGYVKDRFIGETIRSIYDIMDYAVAESIPGLLIFIDFEKAFNSVEWDFLFKCLEAFNFGSNFVHWIETFYKNVQSCTMNIGTVSSYFSLERGVRQGDPLYPYLFIVVLKRFIHVWQVKSFLIPKFVNICALLPTPNELVKQLNQSLFKFLWKGTDKVRRVSVINEYGEGGLKMIDLETMVKSLRLAWLKRIFNGNDVTWKRYLEHQLKPFGGLFFTNYNYDVNDYSISSQFYRELLLWWSHFRGIFTSENNWKKIIWNNKEIRIDRKPVYFKSYYESVIANLGSVEICRSLLNDGVLRYLFIKSLTKSQQGRFTVIFALFHSRFCIKFAYVLIRSGLFSTLQVGFEFVFLHIKLKLTYKEFGL